MESEIDLHEGRRMVTRATGVTCQPWTAADVRWISGHWGIFQNQLRQVEAMGDEITEMGRAEWPWSRRAAVEFAAALVWLATESPRPLRVTLTTLGLFVLAFAWGWF